LKTLNKTVYDTAKAGLCRADFALFCFKLNNVERLFAMILLPLAAVRDDGLKVIYKKVTVTIRRFL